MHGIAQRLLYELMFYVRLDTVVYCVFTDALYLQVYARHGHRAGDSYTRLAADITEL